ncbi:MAG TPA: hypothetical protein DCS93_10690 [Microscillaceae bacterium]|nr:hypothetical protein [Microscillaceae bacterium]
MIDFSTPNTQNTTFTANTSQLLASYSVAQENRHYEFDNVVFAYLTKGLKRINIPSLISLDLQPEMVLVGATKISADVTFPETTPENPAMCFCLEVSRESVWKILDKINEAYGIPELIKEEKKLDPSNFYYGESSQKVLHILYEIQQLIIADVAFKDYWIDLKIEELILSCLQTNMRTLLIESYQQNQLADHPLAFAIDYIKHNLHTRIDIKTLADKAHMSKATFFRQFKHHLGMTPINFIHQERIKAAQQMLSRTNKSVSEVGYSLGYTSPSYFATQFEKVTGCSPSAYRNGG